MKRYYYLFTALLISLFFSVAKAQGQSKVETKVDTTAVEMGNSIELTVKAFVKQGEEVIFPLDEKFGSFEVIDHSAVDTVVNADLVALIKRYELMNFDAGSFTIPQVPVIVDKELFKTDSIQINIQEIAVDTVKTPLYDIKGVSASGASMSSSWLYILCAVLAILVGIGLYFYIRFKQNKNLTEDDKYNTPYEKAVSKLKKLEELKNWTRGDAKPYYSEMSDIVRSFLEDTFGISARELTTFEILTLLNATLKDKNVKLDREVIASFKRILQTSDLVKFAKSQPSEGEILADTIKIQKVVDDINIAYPISAVTQTERIRLREERKKKRLRFRRLVPTAVTVFLLLVTGITYYINTAKEFDYNLFTWNSSKRLLEKEWIVSTYGSQPGITVATPNALERKSINTVQESQLEGVESIQLFKSGSTSDPVQIVLSTVTVTKEFKYSDEQLVSNIVTAFTQQYVAHDVKYESASFENPNGTKGIFVKGGFTSTHDTNGKTRTVLFEGVFTQVGSNRDQVFVFYEEGDTFGESISHRVLDAIVYKQE